jgi:hypothetical protein
VKGKHKRTPPAAPIAPIEPVAAPSHPLWTYAPVLVALASLLPRIVHAHFGLLDDAVTLSIARQVLAHPSVSLHAYESAGRFLPFYWLYGAFCYALGGSHPAVFYAGNAVLLALTVAALIALLRKFAATAFMTWAASLCFIFSAAAADAYGTLSKGEPLALAAMLGSLWMAQQASRADRPVPWWTLAGALALVAVGTRETAIVLVAIAGAWFLLTFWRGLGEPVLLSRRSLAIYLAVLASAVTPLFLVRFLLRNSMAAGSYASHYQLTADNLSQSRLLWGYSLVRNFPELIILLLAAAALAGRKRLRQGQLLLMMLVWMILTAGILMPWPHSDPYYDLAFTAGSSVFCGVMAGELLRMARRTRRGWRAWMRRWTARAVLPVAAALAAIVAINSIGMERAQIAVDDANADLLEALAKLPPRSVVLVNVPATHEYFHELRLHAETLLGRPDLRIAPLDFPMPEAGEEALPHYVVSLDAARQRWPLLRGPMTENVVALWKNYWEKSRGPDVRPPRQLVHTWQLADLGLEAIWCGFGWGPALVCPQPVLRPTLDLRRSFYAWDIYPYQLSKDPVRAASFDRGVWTIQQPSGAPLRLALGEPGDVPVAADWEGDGRLEPGVYRPSVNRWFIDRKLSGKPDLVFSLPGMRPDDVPVAGAWEGRGAGPGYYRPAVYTWRFFRLSGAAVEELPLVHFGIPGSIPLVGDWRGDGRVRPGFLNPKNGVAILAEGFDDSAARVGFTLSPGAPVVVNWTGKGVATVNTFRDGKWARRLANCDCAPSNPAAEFAPVLPPGQPFAGRWKSPLKAH